MDLSQVYEVMERFEASSLAALELTCKEYTLKLNKGGAASAAPLPASPAAAPAPAEQPAAGTLIKAPLVGTFYAAPAPDEPPFVTVGSHVTKGQTVCILEAMKMMSEIPAPCSGTVEAVLAENGTLVGFDAPLFRIREQ